MNDGLSYQNTFRRDKAKFYDDIDDDIIDMANQRNDLKFIAAKGNIEFERLAQHPVVEEEESYDEEKEYEEAERIVDSNYESAISPEVNDINEHEDGGAYKVERLRAGVQSHAGRGSSRSFTSNSVNSSDVSSRSDSSRSQNSTSSDEESPSEESSSEESSANASAESSDESSTGSNTSSSEDKPKPVQKVILDPVLTKGGFKILPQYHDTSIFEEEDLIDRIENGLYKDYIHKGSKKFKDIFDVAIMSKADVDIIFFPALNRKKKLALGIDERICDTTSKDIHFEFDKKETFHSTKDSSDDDSDSDEVEEARKKHAKQMMMMKTV